MLGAKPLSTTVHKGNVLGKNLCPQRWGKNEIHGKVPYAQAMGNLKYVMTSTRPNFCHIVGLVSRYQSNLWMNILDLISPKH